MPPKKIHKVKGFISNWTKNCLDGYSVGSWLTSDPSSRGKARLVLIITVVKF